MLKNYFHIYMFFLSLHQHMKSIHFLIPMSCSHFYCNSFCNVCKYSCRYIPVLPCIRIHAFILFFPFQQQRRENEESENGPNQSSGSSSDINSSDNSSGLGIVTIVGGSLALIAALAAGAYFLHRNMRK